MMSARPLDWSGVMLGGTDVTAFTLMVGCGDAQQGQEETTVDVLVFASTKNSGRGEWNA